MAVERVQGLTFGEVADEYDRFRPSYPDALIGAILDYLAEAPSNSRTHALEVGAGTGKATRLLAAAGLEIEAVEPDPDMATVLARRTTAYPDVNVVVSTFEAYEPTAAFDLLFSAQAWHWTDESTRWQRAAAALRPGGTIALFGNYDWFPDSAIREAFHQAHAEHAPSIDWREEPYDSEHLWDRLWGSELKEQAFNDQRAEMFTAIRTHSRRDYLGFLATHSPYRMLTDHARQRMFDVLAEVLPDPVVCEVASVLYLARTPTTPSMPT